MESVISSLPVKDQFLRKIKCYLFWPVLDQNLNPLLLSSLHKLNHRAFELQLLFSLHPKTEPFNNQLLLKRRMSANIAFHSRKPWNINSGHQYSNKTGRESFGHTSYNSRGWGRGHHFNKRLYANYVAKVGTLFRDVIIVLISHFQVLTPPPVIQDSLQILLTSLPSSSGMTTKVATQPDFIDDNCWFPDSGATNDVTNDLGHLSLSSE